MRNLLKSFILFSIFGISLHLHAAVSMSNASLTCKDLYCIRIEGDGISPSASLDFRLPGSSTILVSIPTEELLHFSQNGKDVVLAHATNATLQAALNTSGVAVWVVNPHQSEWAGPLLIKRTGTSTLGPSLVTAYGYYDGTNYKVSLFGIGFSPGATVDARSSAGSTILHTFMGTEIQRSKVGSFDRFDLSITDPTLRTWLLAAGLKFWVVNGDMGVWDGPWLVRQQNQNDSSGMFGTYDQYASLNGRFIGYRPSGTGDSQMWKMDPLPVVGSSQPTDIYWNSEPERFEIRTCKNGDKWAWLNGYGKRADGKTRYPVDTTKVLLTRNRTTVDMTAYFAAQCGLLGQPYAKYSVDPEPYRLQIWGNAYSSPESTSPDKQYYWSAAWTYSDSDTNACWTGDAMVARQTLRLEEAWWDSGNGWANGPGDLAGTPASPTGTGLQHLNLTSYGRNAGVAWEVLVSTTAGNYYSCLSRRTTY